MEGDHIACPVCTLFLRPGITLKSHLALHPKQKVIDALIRLANSDNPLKELLLPDEAPTSPPITAPSTSRALRPLQPRPSIQAPPLHSPPLPSPPTLPTVAAATSTVPPPLIAHAQGAGPSRGHAPCAPKVAHAIPPLRRILPAPPPLSSSVAPPPAAAASANHSFIYQQILSTSSQQTTPMMQMGQMAQPQYVVPFSFLNGGAAGAASSSATPIVCPPYVYQQQQVIMSGASVQEHQMIFNATSQYQPAASTVQITEIDKEPTLTEENLHLHNAINDVEVKKKIDIDEMDVASIGLTIKVSGEEGGAAAAEEEEERVLDLGSPRSSTSSTGSDFHLRVRTDLSKASQTPCPAVEPAIVLKDDDTVVGGASKYLPHVADQIIHIDGMQLVLCNNFAANQIAAPVKHFDTISKTEPAVLINLGAAAMTPVATSSRCSSTSEMLAHRYDGDSMNAHEELPPQGEFSGQESNASNLTWRGEHSNDLLAREVWESDGSDTEHHHVPPLQCRTPCAADLEDAPTIISVIEAPLNFTCSTCGKGFKSQRERKMHHTEEHAQDAAKKGKRPMKVRRGEIKNEISFDNNFLNRLKDDVNVEGAGPAGEGSTFDEIVIDKEPIPPNTTVELKLSAKCKLEEGKMTVATPTCVICRGEFTDAKALREHLVTVHPNNYCRRFTCGTCDKVMTTEYDYVEHLQMHPLECKLCGKFFYRRQNMQLHMKRHLGIKPYKCGTCEKSFLTKQKHDEHRLVHTREAPLKCNLCNETFRRHSNLIQHRNRHHLNIKRKLKDFVCYCGEVFHSKKKLAWHEEIHETKPKSCTYCSDKFVHMASLTRHMRRAHNSRFLPEDKDNAANVECPVCKGIYMKSSLDVHMKTHTGQKPYACVICNRDFTTKWNLKLHKWTHASRTNKPYKCAECKAAFVRQADYTAHMNSHRSVRPYTCNYCGAQFIRKYNCQRHVREHEKGKTYTCQVCEKSFHRSYYLKDHMRVHNGTRPFACHICGKTSSTKSNHNKHVRIHHAREPISTEN